MRLIVSLLCVFITVVFHGTGAMAQYLEQEFTESTLPEELRAFDVPDDAGGSIGLSWKASPADSPDVSYIVYVSTSENGPWQEAARITSTTGYKSDAPQYFGFRKKQRNHHFVEIQLQKILPGSNVEKPYYFKLAVVKGDSVKEFDEVVSARAKGNWFNMSKLNNLIIMVVFSALVLYFISHARRHPGMFLRKISGLEAVDEALGRATEMGRPVLFVHGLTPIGSISTLAAINILSRIATRVAEYDTVLKVVNNDPIVMTVSQEVVKESYLEAGRPDAYNQDNVVMVASEQFPYVVAVAGIMTREKTAANFFIGFFYAESLLLAETGATTGAIQVAATDSYTQLPFFITTCDYTLMGEELYAASAYLSREPMLLGSLRAQDIGKAVVIGAIFFGTILSSSGINFITQLFTGF
ncbi:MAG: fibronectin type III domain-containing protein [Candidatus Brocadiales bacterium]